MNKIIISAAVAMMLIGCGGGGTTSSTDSSTDTNTDTNTIEGTGTVSNPYVVGNGEFNFNTEAYFKINTSLTGDICNILAYNVYNLNAFNETEMFDESFSSIEVNDDLDTYTIDTSGDYIIKANTWENNNNGNGIVGIYSTCITTTNAYALDEVQEGLNTFAGEANHLYKIELGQSSTIELNRVDNTDYVSFYNARIENVYKDYGDSHVVDLQAGTNYVLVGSFRDEEQTAFSFTVTPN